MMKKYYICQTRSHKTYITLPDDWSGIPEHILSQAVNIGSVFTRDQNDDSLTKTILGPNQMFMNIVVTPLRQGEAEPTIESTSEYFDGLAYRQNLFETLTGKIEVRSKDHFTVKYYRIHSAGAQFIKKYCLYIERLEYLITTVLANVSKDDGRPDETEMNKKENIYDKIVQSLYLVAR
jgi:hypothetical protein